jgi:hypothetical protein
MKPVNFQKLVAKINRETKEGKITWQKSKTLSEPLIGTEALLGFVYTTKILNSHYRLYRFRHKYFYEEDLFEWLDGKRLELYDPNTGKSEFTISNTSMIEELYDSVQLKTSRIEEFYEEYLGDEPDYTDPNLPPDISY